MVLAIFRPCRVDCNPKVYPIMPTNPQLTLVVLRRTCVPLCSLNISPRTSATGVPAYLSFMGVLVSCSYGTTYRRPLTTT